MGLAASQARLLSITQRISDNELRAQIINNQKMRLSSESSRVSENYINALNKTNLVFANYDENDNAQNVPLTFNNLTAFNQYNNQYGLTNTAGNILISEREADLYTQSKGKLDEFLRLHGIEYTTSYWDTISNQLEDVEAYYSSPDNNGVVDSADGVYNFYNAEQLREMYEGSNNVASYENTIKTQAYNDFAAYVDKFEIKMGELNQANIEAASLRARFITALTGSASYSWSNLGSGTSAGNCNISATTIATNFDGLSSTDAQTVIDNINARLSQEACGNTMGFKNVDGKWCSLLEDNVQYTTSTPSNLAGLSEIKLSDNERLKKSGASWVFQVLDSSNNWITDSSAASVSVPTGYPKIGANGIYEYVFGVTYKNDDGTTDETINYVFADPDFNPSVSSTPNPKLYAELTTEDKNNFAKNYISQVVTEEITKLIANHKISTTGPIATRNFTAEELSKINVGAVAGLTEVVHDLASLMFGSNISAPSPYNYTDAYQLIIILNYLTEGNIKWSTSNNQIDLGNDYKGNKVSFNWSHLALPKEVFNAYTLDTLMNIFGEPVYTYLYTDGNGNIIDDGSKRDASAEARWLTNLFEKIQSSGYQMLPNGLASSTEWLQFALENGIVVMEQVDAENNWKGITYNSCSDISEQTDSNAATIAEAEYNKAMRQIESKDEMFDLELKNIDTEHSSLQSEYESVKKAMSGNIERTFQMYS